MSEPKTQLEDAIRAELRDEVRLAPAGAATKASVLCAVAGLPMDEGGRHLRRWLVPMLAAAAVVLVAIGVTALPRVLSSHRVAPAHKPSPVVSTTEAPASASADPTPSPSRSGSASSPAPQNWYQGLGIAGLPHTPGLCTSSAPLVAGQLAPAVATVAGESSPLWLVPVTCQGSTDASWPAPLEVFGYRPSGPVLLQTLAYSAGDRRSLEVTGASYADGILTLTESGYSPHDPLCCRSLRYRQDFTWQPGGAQHGQFRAGPEVDVVPACTGSQLAVSTSNLITQSGDGLGLLLEYSNTGAQPCKLHGYPGASAVDAAGVSVVEARRSASGFFGGLADSTQAPPTVTLFMGSTASAVIEWSGSVLSPTVPCYQAAGLASTPPNTTATRQFGKPGRFCDLQVHPVVRDGTGRG